MKLAEKTLLRLPVFKSHILTELWIAAIVYRVKFALVMIYTHLRLPCVHRPPMSRFSEFRCSVGDWKLTKMAACNHFSFSKVCDDYFDGFS